MNTAIIAFASWKGGTGKTLLAVNAIQQAQSQGLKARLYDFDPQGSALRYLHQRKRNSPDLPAIDAVKAEVDEAAANHLMQKAQEGSHDLLICDLPGADSYVMDKVIGATDSIIIPISPAPLEIMVTSQLVHHGLNREWDMVLLPNNLPAIKKRQQYLVNTLIGMGAEIAPVGLTRRVNHWDAAVYGQGICEYAPKSPAADEIRSFWTWLAERWNLPLPYECNDEPELEARYG